MTERLYTGNSIWNSEKMASFNLAALTFDLKLVQDIVKVNPSSKCWFHTSNGSARRALTNRPTDRWTGFQHLQLLRIITWLIMRWIVWFASLAPALRYSLSWSFRAPRGARLSTRHRGWRLIPRRGTMFLWWMLNNMLSSFRAFKYASHAFFIGSFSHLFFSA